MTGTERIHDTWSPLDYIADAMPTVRGPVWLDGTDQRRLTAYRVLAAYRDNIRRWYLPDAAQRGRIENVDGRISIEREVASSHREYGDADLLVTTARALVLGETQDVEPTDGTPAPAAAWWRQWVVSERFTQKLLQGEADAVGLGDAVYVLVPSDAKRRPRLKVYDPGFYFPDTLTPVEGWEDEDYPPIVHLAWEEEDPTGVRWVVRSTWRMTPLEQPRPAAWGEVVSWTCEYRKVRYAAADLIDNVSVYSPDMGPARSTVVVQDWTDLLVDFIPVVHVPNTPEEWGTSVLTRAVQLLDDTQNTDTDLAIASQSAAPALATTGVTAGGLTGRPGEQIGMPTGGTAEWLDTSRNLDALLKLSVALSDRLAQNTRLSQALLGRVQPNDVPSGYALALGFHPARQLMRELRTMRHEKYPLVLKFAYRMAQSYGWATPGPAPAPTVTLGASLPSDLASAVQLVTDLLPAGGISTSTAVRVLIEAGLPIADAEKEVQLIRTEQTKQAVEVFEATGNAAAAAERLGIAPVVPVTPPAQVTPTA